MTPRSGLYKCLYGARGLRGSCLNAPQLQAPLVAFSGGRRIR